MPTTGRKIRKRRTRAKLNVWYQAMVPLLDRFYEIASAVEIEILVVVSHLTNRSDGEINPHTAEPTRVERRRPDG